jgi:hypothetical protein
MREAIWRVWQLAQAEPAKIKIIRSLDRFFPDALKNVKASRSAALVCARNENAKRIDNLHCADRLIHHSHNLYYDRIPWAEKT